MSTERDRRSKLDRWGLELESSRVLESARVRDDGLCWWCKARPATTAEHKFKATDLRRMADRDERGVADPATLWKGGGTYVGELKSLGRGTAVQWSKSMCKTCNGGRDRHMDAAYEAFSDFIWHNQDRLEKMRALDWREVFPDDWQAAARDVARYYAKQVGCMFAQQRLPVPAGLINFMDGAPSANEFVFALVRDRGRLAAQRTGKRHGLDARGYWLPPARVSLTPDGTAVAAFSHQSYIGFIGANIDHAPGLYHPSFFDTERASLVTVSGASPWVVRYMVTIGATRERFRRWRART